MNDLKLLPQAGGNRHHSLTDFTVVCGEGWGNEWELLNSLWRGGVFRFGPQSSQYWWLWGTWLRTNHVRFDDILLPIWQKHCYLGSGWYRSEMPFHVLFFQILLQGHTGFIFLGGGPGFMSSGYLSLICDLGWAEQTPLSRTGWFFRFKSFWQEWLFLSLWA